LEPTLADLEIATFAVDEVVEGTQTGWSDGRLTLALPQLAVGAGDPALAEATVEVVRPGDSVRISNVLDVALPNARVEAALPGAHMGAARLHRLAGVAVLTVCDWAGAGYEGADELPDSLVDMAGPGADRSPWGATTNVVVRCVPSPGAEVAEADRAVRGAATSVATTIAEATAGASPDDVRSIGPLPPADAALPAIAMILQVASEGPLVDTFIDGEPLGEFSPRVLDERQLYEGRLTNGAYDWPGVRNVTAVYQDLALLRELRAAHGERLRFAGLILAPGYLDGAEQKRRAAEASAELAESLGADGVVCTTFSSGNSHTDTMLTVRACERRGIGTVALVCETNGGLTDHVAEADCLVSTGNEDELVEAWTPDRVVGGEERARVGERVPAVNYLGGLVETGDARWTAVPA
jgi:glycine reductase